MKLIKAGCGEPFHSSGLIGDVILESPQALRLDAVGGEVRKPDSLFMEAAKP